MKRFCTSALLACFLVSCVSAQNYTFDYFQQDYALLQGDSSISEGIPWYNDTWDIPLGFDFNFMGHTYQQLTAWNENLYFDIDNEDQFIFPCIGCFLVDKGYVTPGTEILSPISIQYEGASGSRIFKFQVRNAGFEDGGEQDSIHFQIWLYETTHVIEFHFGPRNITPGIWGPESEGPVVGLISFADVVAYAISGSPDAPTADVLDPNDPDAVLMLLTGPAPADVVWRFTPLTTGVNMVEAPIPLDIWPNPCQRWLNVQLPAGSGDVQILVFDAMGRPVLAQTLAKKGRLDLGRLSPGVYALKASGSGGTCTRTVFKQ